MIFIDTAKNPCFRVLYQKVPTLNTIRVKACLKTLDRSKVMGRIGWCGGRGVVMGQHVK